MLTGHANGAGLPPIEILYNNSEILRLVAEAIQQMWHRDLGIEVRLVSQEYKSVFASRRIGDYQVLLGSWTADYLDATTFLDLWRSDNGGDSWYEVSGNLPTDFGFVIDVHAHEPDTIYVVPIKSDSEHFPPDGKLRVYRSRTGGHEWEALTSGLPQSDCYVNVLRDAMAVDALDSCGVYFGTTGGQVYASADGGDNWTAIARDLPGVLSVEVQTLP